MNAHGGRNLTDDPRWCCARLFPTAETKQLVGDKTGGSCTRLLLAARCEDIDKRGVSDPPGPRIERAGG